MPDTQPATLTIEQLQAQIAQLTAALKAQKAQAPKPSFRVSEKRGLSVYGLGRFPVTLYKRQWVKLLDLAPEIRVFMAAHDSELADEKSVHADAGDTQAQA